MGSLIQKLGFQNFLTQLPHSTIEGTVHRDLDGLPSLAAASDVDPLHEDVGNELVRSPLHQVTQGLDKTVMTFALVREREREREIECVCVCERERESERDMERGKEGEK